MKYIFYILLLIVSCKNVSTSESKMVLADTLQKQKIESNQEIVKKNSASNSKNANLQTGLVNDDLCYVNNYYSKIDNTSNENEQEFCLKKIIDLTLITENDFNELLKLKPDTFLNITNKYNKKDNILELKTKSSSIKLLDKPNEEESMVIHHYIGEIEFLNQYLISRDFWEDRDYIYLDKETGKKTNQFVDYPYISPDKKNIICIFSNGYEKSGDLTLHKITDDNKIELELTASFSRWMPALEPQECFWISNKQFVVKVLPSKAFWKKNGSYNDDFQYIKITIL